MDDLLTIDNALPGHEDLVQFADSHRVGLQAGDYSLDVRQVVSGASFAQEIWQTARNFSVLGERFQLDQGAVQSVFPPEGSRGDFWHVLPHIVLERSTLPWERSALQNGADAQNAPPWLALLVFHPGDPLPVPQTANAGSLNVSLEKAQAPEDAVMVIDVPKSLLTSLIPDLTELSQLTHVRRRLAFLGERSLPGTPGIEQFLAAISELRGGDAQAFTGPVLYKMDAADKNNLPAGVSEAWVLRNLPTDEAFEIMKIGEAQYRFFYVAHESATVLANRLPSPGGQNVAHLVSVENGYTDNGFDAGAQSAIRLVSLKQWTFFCEAEEKTFKGLVMNLNKADGVETAADWKLPLPAGSTEAAPFLNAGFVPLRHRFREGSRSISWYHGPLVPSIPGVDGESLLQGRGEKSAEIRHADQLVLYNGSNGMFDVSYAAAWELGRLLTLRNTKLALDLFYWKRQHSQSLQSARHLADYGYHLPVVSQNDVADPNGTREKAIWAWLDELSLLYHIPAHYLLPDPRLLPVESLRFFTVDPHWIACLRDGAFSVGRVYGSDAKNDRQKMTQRAERAEAPALSGFLLRSDLVTGWPKMQVTAYDTVPDNSTAKAAVPDKTGGGVLTPLRLERLSNNVLFALFPGRVRAVDLFLSPETLHFGLDLPAARIDSGQPQRLAKTKRDPDTGMETTQGGGVQIPFRSLPQRVLDIGNLAKNLTGSVSAHGGSLALQLIAGAELVRITR